MKGSSMDSGLSERREKPGVRSAMARVVSANKEQPIKEALKRGARKKTLKFIIYLTNT
jgi:hypothetical protein